MKIVMEKVRAELKAEPTVMRCPIEINYQDGELILSGDVGSFYQKQMAQVAALRVINHRCPYLALTVKNDLRVPGE